MTRVEVALSFVTVETEELCSGTHPVGFQEGAEELDSGTHPVGLWAGTKEELDSDDQPVGLCSGTQDEDEVTSVADQEVEEEE